MRLVFATKGPTLAGRSFEGFRALLIGWGLAKSRGQRQTLSFAARIESGESSERYDVGGRLRDASIRLLRLPGANGLPGTKKARPTGLSAFSPGQGLV